jgi:hypothetical protein
MRVMADAPAADRALLDEAVALARDAGQTTLRWFRAADLAVDRIDGGHGLATNGRIHDEVLELLRAR